MQALFEVILPVFLVLGAGYAATRAGLFPDPAVDGLMRFAQSFAVPCLLMKSIATLDLGAVYDLDLFASFYAGAFAGFFLAAFGARLLLGRPGPDCVVIGFAGMFSNTLLLGLPIMERAYGPASLAGNYAIISVHAPLLYAFGITVMEIVRSHGRALPTLQLLRQIGGGILFNPLVIGIAAGFLVNLGHVDLPAPVWSAVDMMVRAALPAALFGLGGVLVRYRPQGDWRAIGMVTAISLIVHPAITWFVGQGLAGLSTGQLRSAVITGAMAPGINAYLFANMYGIGKRVVASSVLLATALSIVTVWGWLTILP